MYISDKDLKNMEKIGFFWAEQNGAKKCQILEKNSGIPRHHKPTVSRFKTTLLTQWFSGVPLNIYKDAKSIAPRGLVKDTAQVNFDDFKMLRSTRGTFQLNREKEKRWIERMWKKKYCPNAIFLKKELSFYLWYSHIWVPTSPNILGLCHCSEGHIASQFIILGRTHSVMFGTTECLEGHFSKCDKQHFWNQI